jgi:hypothetical protein
MQLDDVELIISDMLPDILQTRINENTNALALLGQVGWALTDITAGLRPEDEAHEVDAQGFGLTDILRLSHATYLDHS